MKDYEIFKQKLDGHFKTVGYINPLTKENDPMQLVRAFHQMLKNGHHNGWVLKIIGFGEEYTTIQEYIIANQLQKQILLYGPLSDKEIYDVIKRVDFMVCTRPVDDGGDMCRKTGYLGTPMILPMDSLLQKVIKDGSGYHYYDGSDEGLLDSLIYMCEHCMDYDVEQIRGIRIG